jgi:hypothetical protein
MTAGLVQIRLTLARVEGGGGGKDLADSTPLIAIRIVLRPES